MALYRRGRVWYADYHADGVRVQESTGTANKREAEKILALRVSEVQRGVFVKPVKSRCRSSVRDTSSMRKLTSVHGSATCRC
jgi:hypothetical protein